MKAKWMVYTDTGDWIVEAYSASGAEREVMRRTWGRADREDFSRLTARGQQTTNQTSNRRNNIMSEITKPSWMLDIPADEYHAATKANEYLSSHRLNVFRKCPLEYIKRCRGEIVEADTASFILGRATHTFIIEGRSKFDAEYVVADGPINPKTGKAFGKATDKYREWAEAQTKPVISTEDTDLISKMQFAVCGQDKAMELLSRGFAETTVRGEWDGLPVQIRADWYDPERNILVDLKTCADLERFRFDVRDFGYRYQLAFYAKVIADAREDGKRPECWIVAVEKREPFRVGVWRITEHHIDIDNGEPVDRAEVDPMNNAAMVAELKKCREGDVWPTRFEGWGEM